MSRYEDRKGRWDAYYAEKDAKEAEQARRDAEIDRAAEHARAVLPGDVGAALAAVLDEMKPQRATDGYLSFVCVSRSSDTVRALADAILAVEAS